MFRNSLCARIGVAQHTWIRLRAHLLDLAAFSLSTVLAFELRFDGVLPARYAHPMSLCLGIWAAVKSIAFIAGEVSWRHWRYTSAQDAVRLVLVNLAGSILGCWIILSLLGSGVVPRSIYVLDWLICCVLTLGARLAVKMAVTIKRRDRIEVQMTRTLIYGAGAAGLALLRELLENRSLLCDVVGLIDDDPQKAGLALQGRRVFGNGETLGTWVQKKGIKKVLIAIPSATGQQMVRILRFATDAKVEYKMVPSLGELIQGVELGKQIREVAVEDLLGRKPVELEMGRVSERVHGRVVMITGAAGSIGSEICRQIARLRPLALIGFDQAETPLFNLDKEIASSFPEVAFYAEIGDINRPDTLQRVIQQYRPSILYHAAAYKHVPLMERHVFAAVETNIFGTWNVARAAAENGVGDFVMISTDKAVRPSSMMGVTKRTAELLIHALGKETSTRFVAVRFGNVLGSNGSVVPTFKEQISRGGPVTVTHPEVRRYFMTIPEAAQLVLQAFSIGQGGETFVLDMGEPVRIHDLAENLILLSGLQPQRDIEIKYSGLRPGEKMFEELNLQDERLMPTLHNKIRSYVGHHDLDARQIRAWLHRLEQIGQGHDVASLVLALKELVPDYSPGSELLKNALASKPNYTRSATLTIPNRQAANTAGPNATPAALTN